MIFKIMVFILGGILLLAIWGIIGVLFTSFVCCVLEAYEVMVLNDDGEEVDTRQVVNERTAYIIGAILYVILTALLIFILCKVL